MYSSMSKFSIAQVNAYMTDVGFTDFEKYQVAFFQFVAVDGYTMFEMVAGTAREIGAVNAVADIADKSGTVYTFFGQACITVPYAHPGVYLAVQFNLAANRVKIHTPGPVKVEQCLVCIETNGVCGIQAKQRIFVVAVINGTGIHQRVGHRCTVVRICLYCKQ